MRTPVVPHIVTKVSKTMDRGKGTERKCSRDPKLGMYFYTAGTKMFLHSHPGTVFPEHGTQGRSRSPADYGSTLARATAASSFARRQRASLHQRADPSRCRSAGGSTCAPWHGMASATSWCAVRAGAHARGHGPEALAIFINAALVAGKHIIFSILKQINLSIIG